MVNKKGLINGFVDLGSHISPGQEGFTRDHGPVVLLQPFSGKWQQILLIFGARGNVKADVLSRIIVDAAISVSWSRSST